MDREALHKLAVRLDRVRERPAMYLGPVTVEVGVAWLSGFEAALHALDDFFDAMLKAREAAFTARGWTWSAAHPADEMVGRGLTPAEVVDELLAVEAEVLRLLARPRRTGPDLVG